MKAMMRIPVLAGALFIAACGQQAEAPLSGAWVLDGGQSRLTFTTVKAGKTAEAHSFKQLAGAVAADGAASLEIDLASVATNVDVRDERMREFLFETGLHPKATATVQLDPAAFASLKPGESTEQTVEATLDLHGMKAPVEAQLSVTRIAADKVKVETAAPIIVDAEGYGLAGGIAKLQELANLPGIAPQVPVSFSLVFEQQD